MSLLVLPISSLISSVYHSLSLLVLVVSCTALFDPTVTFEFKEYTVRSEALTQKKEALKYYTESFLPLYDLLTQAHLSMFLSAFISHTAGALWPLPADLHFKTLLLNKGGRLARHRGHGEDWRHTEECSR